MLVVDEAQNLSPEVLEQVRLLTNLETNTQKLLQIILIGQPELRELLARNELRQLAQRITGRYHLNPLSHEETTAYVRHRLRVAGATTDIFNRCALDEVYRLSAGVPRVINVICDRALLGGYSLDRHRVTASTGAQRRLGGLREALHAALAAVGRDGGGGGDAGRRQPRALAVAAVGERGASSRTLNVSSIPASARARMRGPEGLTPRRAIGTAPPASAPATVSAQAPPAPTAAPATEPLATLLAKHSVDTTTDAAFATLFDLWGDPLRHGRH